MAICPKCKSRYRDGFKTCSDCGVELAEESELESMLDSVVPTTEKWVFLKNVYDGYEYAELTALFEANDIAYVEKQRGSGQYLKIATGMNNYGTDLYVLESQLDKVKDLMNFIYTEAEDILEETKDAIREEQTPKKKGFFRGYILIFCIIPIFILMYMIFSIL